MQEVGPRRGRGGRCYAPWYCMQSFIFMFTKTNGHNGIRHSAGALLPLPVCPARRPPSPAPLALALAPPAHSVLCASSLLMPTFM